MTDAGWNYPGLGFDPLPGDPEVARSLQEDARIFGQRMTDEAKRLRRFAHREGWQGEAADAFAEHLDTLPRDLQRCGDAFSNLALALGNYAHAFTMAKAKAADLERRAVEARKKIQEAELTLQGSMNPALQPPGAVVSLPDAAGAVHAAEDELGAILREAHQFAERFDESPEVQQIAAAIRSFTEFAPDEPRWNRIRRLAGDVFSHTPVGAALNAAHELINHYAEFFNDLAGVLGDISGVIGVLSIPLLFFPPMGTAAGVLALGLTAGSTGIKTSLYAGRARDANGNLYVTGGDLVSAYADLGMAAVGVAGGAAASRASKLAEGQAISFAGQLAEDVSARTFREALEAPGVAARLVGKAGPKAATKIIGSEALKSFQLADPGSLYNWGGVGLSAFGPLTTSDESHNVFGWRSVYSLGTSSHDLVTDAPNQPDLQLRVQPTMRAASDVEASPTIKAPEPPVKPVMER
jgi:uncharacterized protein YukE